MTEVSVSQLLGDSIKWHHVHAFVDKLESLQYYKTLEERFNKWHELRGKEDSISVDKGREIFQKLSNTSSIKEFVSHKQDLVTQLITGMSYRITAVYESSKTRNFALSTSDPKGAYFVVSAILPGDSENQPEKKQKLEEYDHFDRAHLDRFIKDGQSGFACLTFEIKNGMVDIILDRYRKKHPKLLLKDTYHEYVQEGFNKPMKILDAFSFYSKDKSGPDKRTVLRFFEHGQSDYIYLPGMKSVKAIFPKNAFDLFSDHWVSNVFDRNEYLQILKDTIGFRPKVNFNAGVVAAGEAIIESTVAGNDPSSCYTTPKDILKDRSQIFLPINNALSETGHVFLYLKEIGQGIQHIANRTDDVVSFINQVNETREMTGYGFSFLKIPRSYYGRLTKKDLTAIEGVSDNLATRILEELVKAKYVNEAGTVNLKISDDKIASIASLLGDFQETFSKYLTQIQFAIRRGIYKNLYSLLGDLLDEKEYLRVVKNQILVDIQGRDILYQIFSSCVLQKACGSEAPFIETIQRICGVHSDKDGNVLPSRAGCGGFGIRNFLTLFLSIEVTKAMNDINRAKAENDSAALAIAKERVRLFESQLTESNPILTAISDAMTSEEDVLEELAKLNKEEDTKLKKELETKIANLREAKKAAQQELVQCSNKYKAKMKKLRE